jgi:hypothetical protein
LEAFIGRYGLNRILEMPKLKLMQFRFYANSGGENAVGGGKEYRHRLCNPLWRWATKKMVEKWGVSDYGDGNVTTTLPEDYEHVNMSRVNFLPRRAAWSIGTHRGKFIY